MCLIPIAVPVATESFKNGLMFFQEKDILIKHGTHHVKIDTDLNPSQHINQIRTKVNEFGQQCDKAAKNFAMAYCRAEVQSLEILAEKSMAEIESLYPEATKRRVKRESKGAIQKIWEWLIGSDDVEEGLSSSKSMGVLTHAVTSFKDIERKLQNKEQHVEDEMERLARGVDTESAKSRWYSNQAYVTGTLLSVYQLLRDQILTIENTYTELEKVMITSEEIDSIVDHMNKQVEEGHVPLVSQSTKVDESD